MTPGLGASVLSVSGKFLWPSVEWPFMRSVAAPSPEAAVASRREIGPRLCVVLLVAITAGGAVLRFLHLTRKSFWLDEGVSVTIARLDLSNLLHTLWRREANMALDRKS